MRGSLMMLLLLFLLLMFFVKVHIALATALSTITH